MGVPERVHPLFGGGEVRKRLIALLMILLFCLPYASIVHADPVHPDQTLSSEEVISNSKWSVVNKLKSLQTSLDNNAFAQYGVFYNLYYLVQYAGYLDFMLTADDLAFSQTEQDVYVKVYVDLVDKFNSKYGETEDGTEKLPFRIDTPMRSSKSEVKNSIKSLVETRIPEYCIQYLEILRDKSGVTVTGESVTGSAENLDEYQREITKINQILAFMSQHKSYCQSLLPKIEEEPDERLSDMANYDKFKAMLTANPDASAVLNEGKEISSQIVNTIGNVSYKDANTYIEQLANVALKTDADDKTYGADLWKNTSATDHFQLNDTYLAMLATSAVYTPFVSKVGDERFMEALKSAVGTDNESKVSRLYDEIKDYRKPLFMIQSKSFLSTDDTVVSGGGRRKYSGDAVKITLADLLSYSGSDKEIALLTVKGDLKVNPEDGNSYAFFMEGGPGKYLGQGGTQELNIKSEGDVSESAMNEDAKSLSNAVYIPDGTTVSTVHWTDVLFELGDSTLSGSMNRALLTNIEHDLRNKKELDDLGKSYLYVNPFGDIVLDDNTVIIPGSANASIIVIPH